VIYQQHIYHKGFLSLMNPVCPKTVEQFHNTFGNTERYIERETDNKQNTTNKTKRA